MKIYFIKYFCVSLYEESRNLAYKQIRKSLRCLSFVRVSSFLFWSSVIGVFLFIREKNRFYLDLNFTKVNAKKLKTMSFKFFWKSFLLTFL